MTNAIKTSLKNKFLFGDTLNQRRWNDLIDAIFDPRNFSSEITDGMTKATLALSATIDKVSIVEDQIVSALLTTAVGLATDSDTAFIVGSRHDLDLLSGAQKVGFMVKTSGTFGTANSLAIGAYINADGMVMDEDGHNFYGIYLDAAYTHTKGIWYGAYINCSADLVAGEQYGLYVDMSGDITSGVQAAGFFTGYSGEVTIVDGNYALTVAGEVSIDGTGMANVLTVPIAPSAYFLEAEDDGTVFADTGTLSVQAGFIKVKIGSADAYIALYSS